MFKPIWLVEEECLPCRCGVILGLFHVPCQCSVIINEAMACEKLQKVQEGVHSLDDEVRKDAPDGIKGHGFDNEDNWVEFAAAGGITVSKTACMVDSVLEILLKLRMDAVKSVMEWCSNVNLHCIYHQNLRFP